MITWHFVQRVRVGLAVLGMAGGIAGLGGCAPQAAGPVAPARVFNLSDAGAFTVKFDFSQGDYTLINRASGWTFTGSTGHPITAVATTDGVDSIGNCRIVTLHWNDAGPIAGTIKFYTNQPIVLFGQTCDAARPAPPGAFPSFAHPLDSGIKSAGPLHVFGYTDNVFAPPSFSGGQGASPWLLFDNFDRAAIVSPAANFMTVDLKRDSKGNLSSGLNLRLGNIPAGFTHQTLLVTADTIHDAWHDWGNAMTTLAGKQRPGNEADIGLQRFGYWTDNGAAYYYNYDQNIGYAQMILNVADAFKQLNIPLAYMQLDSWWYQKSNTRFDGKAGDGYKVKKLPRGSWNLYGGTLSYTAHPAVFPKGLAAFDQQLGMPLMVHNRWTDPTSPYHQKYKFSGLAGVDPGFWNEIAAYLQSSGVILYEQDWLNDIYAYSPEFAATTTAGDAFTDSMARAMKQHGLSIQYCMGTPRFYMQGSKYDNLTTVRVSDDRFIRGQWGHELYTSQLATALGEWPWVDNFRSNELANLTLATLSAGMVGIGDYVDQINPANIATAIRADGMIVKPDTALVPLDRVYIADATDKKSPMIAAAFTDHGPVRTAYVFAYPRSAEQKRIEFHASELGIPGDVYVLDTLTNAGRRVAAGETFTGSFNNPAYKQAWETYTVAGIGKNGIALLGDPGKIVGTGRQRISDLQATETALAVTIARAANEGAITLTGYSEKIPVATSADAVIASVEYDPKTRLFTVLLSPKDPTASAMHLTLTAGRS